MNTERLIEKYLEILEQRDEMCSETFRTSLENIAEKLKGKRVCANVSWHDGRVTASVGVILSLRFEFVYIDTTFGVLEVDAFSMSPEDDE